MATPQFGDAPPEACPDRPAAFAVIERDGLIALVQVPRLHHRLALDLPGGGIDPGETAAQAAVRECGEEAGLRVALDAEPFVRADHYFLHGDGEVRNTRGVFFSGRVVAQDQDLKIEDDHTLVWTDPQEAVLRLDRESHAWAVAAWLRLRARG
ncbi:NUDIX domain-containing protein [uncultured Phenylobacterium sp.]|uniref:NUDIX domain-containing protein n=1 Tax=uncultured Phenylobacterium sp. TaxID=349273 RepID=UPI0025D9168A|nr:NUDIX domain-containing protein [uncultured Phenylobacterium sp.]